jgi:ATP-dependent HslUV protease ATP-binding subunit HslU
MKALTPKEIVFELNRFIVGQGDAKKAVAVALRNRWRRFQLDSHLREEIVPKNILMIGPTGVGKTEIARRLAKLDQAPFIKVEATKFTEVGYVGRDVEQIIRDLMEISVQITKERNKINIQEKAQHQAQERVLDILVGEASTASTREKFRTRLLEGEFDNNEIEIQIMDNSAASSFDIPGMPGSQMLNLGDMFGKAFARTKTRQTIVKEALKIFENEESDKLIDQEKLMSDAIELTQQRGIVFIDEIDKICAREGRSSDVSREGVQRDLLPLIEGTVVTTKHGPVKTDHILFIASGAFHLASPSDLLPELQGRLPIRVELKPLTKEDFVRILQEPEANLIKQYQALLSVEGINLTFSQEAIIEIAYLAETLNQTVENIGARRLHTILEKLLEDISFHADESDHKDIEITEKDVKERITDLAKNIDLSKFIL